MYEKILITLDATPTDRAILEHIKPLAKLLGSQIVLLHVAVSVPAQWSGETAGGQEVDRCRKYLQTIEAEFNEAGIANSSELAFGDPVTEIVKRVHSSKCNLVAMSTHGHRLVADLILGTTASRVQHSISVPVLMLRAK